MRNGFVYIMRRDDGIRKVGCTVNLKRRLTEVCGMSRLHYEYERTWEMGDHAAICVESAAHFQLKSARYLDDGGMELYALPLDKLIEVIQSVIQKVAVEIPEGLASCYSLPDRALDRIGRQPKYKLAQLEEAYAEGGSFRAGATRLKMTTSGFKNALERERVRALVKRELIQPQQAAI